MYEHRKEKKIKTVSLEKMNIYVKSWLPLSPVDKLEHL